MNDLGRLLAADVAAIEIDDDEYDPAATESLQLHADGKCGGCEWCDWL